RAGIEMAGDPQRGGLPAVLDLFAHHQPGAAAAGRKMDEVAVARERLPRLARDEGLAARGIVLAARQVEQDRLVGLAVLRSARAEMRPLVRPEFDLAEA